MFFDKGFAFFLADKGKDLDVLFGVGIAHVQPELAEFVGRGVFGRQPNIAAFGLAKFAAVGLGDERAGEGISFAAVGTTNQFGTGGDVAPLVATAHLQFAVFGGIQVQKVVTLQQLISKFGE